MLVRGVMSKLVTLSPAVQPCRSCKVWAQAHMQLQARQQASIAGLVSGIISIPLQAHFWLANCVKLFQ
eukprot:scaffold66861_cov20-Tisochrysis_lutea.AAC.1